MRTYERKTVLIEITVGEPMHFNTLKDAAFYLYDSDMSPKKPTCVSIYTGLIYALKHSGQYKNYIVKQEG